MKKMVPRARAQIKLKKRPWMSFLHQIDGWMVDCRARKEGGNIENDIYCHHKSGFDFKSTITVVEFILHNRFQQSKKIFEPRGPRNPPRLEGIE
ncbi:hypothetical protein LINPERHAP1_LOCUS16225, partial [Linum perenne]